MFRYMYTYIRIEGLYSDNVFEEPRPMLRTIKEAQDRRWQACGKREFQSNSPCMMIARCTHD